MTDAIIIAIIAIKNEYEDQELSLVELQNFQRSIIILGSVK